MAIPTRSYPQEESEWHCTHQFVFVFLNLKVPKREIFDRSDFPDFYTIKSLRAGDFGVKIKKKF
jgi:hypothetical protein